jgi:monoamine oxidase
MNHPKSKLLKSLLDSFQKALFIQKYQHIDVDTLLQIENSDLYTRRKFLFDVTKTISILGVGSTLPLSSCTSSSDKAKKNEDSSKTPSIEKVKVAIIGAGIAGLNCAYQLQKKGILAQIFEGDKRIGGRIDTKENELGQGITTEYGGEFVDANHADIRNLAHEFDIELYDTQLDIVQNKLIKDAYFFNNQHYTEKDTINQFRKISKKIESDLAKCGEDYETPFGVKLDNTSLEEYVRSLNCEKWLQDLLIYAYVAEYGLDASEQSALNMIDMISTDTNNGFAIFGDSDERYKIKGGSSKVIEALTNKLKNQITTESRLIALRPKGNSYILIFDNKKEIIADFVVLAIPFTTLRSVDLQIELSEEKKKCIAELGYGQNNKLLLGFNNRPWRESKTKYAGYLFHPDIHNGWDSSQMQNNNLGVGGYTVFLGGAASIKMAQLSQKQNLYDKIPESLVQDYLQKLDSVFDGFKKQYNGNNKAALWSNNPFVNASYACYKTGQWTTISGKEIEPVGNVFFAGEHCSEDFQGYMNGGAETGRKASEDILKKIK